VLCSAFVFSQKITLKIASVAPSRSPWDIEQKKLAQEWATITNGNVTIQFYDTMALGGEEDVIQKLRAVRPGQKPPLDGAVFTNVGLYMIAPESSVFTLCAPFLFRNQEEVNYILEKKADMLEKAVKDSGYVLLGWFSVGWIHFMTKEEARTPEKLKTLRLALGGIASNDISTTFKLAGFKTENITTDKLTQSIKSPGGVQGVYTIPMYGYATKFYESLPYVLNVPICPILSAFIVSEKVWAQIPESYKPALLAAVQKAEQVFDGVQKESDKSNLQLMEQNGAKLVTPTAQEFAHWEEVFNNDIKKVAESNKSVINSLLLEEIKVELNKYRALNTGARN
jgi:TRAP-type C4-dicarboxylate transport system substrate-binding protein